MATNALQDSSAAVVSALANHLFGRERWSREKLARHAGKRFRFLVGPWSANLSIDTGGRFKLADATVEPALTVTLPVRNIPVWFSSPDPWRQLMTAEGDAELAETLNELAHTVPWMMERDFAQWLGPLAGPRLMQVGSALLAFPPAFAAHLVKSVAASIPELSASPLDRKAASHFGKEVAVAARQLSELDRRLVKLESLPLQQRNTKTSSVP